MRQRTYPIIPVNSCISWKRRRKKPDEDILQKMISASPSSLSYKDENGDLPMQSALYDPESAPYVPLLAKEGVNYKVGGEDGRGGLLVDNEAGDNTLLLF